MPRFKCFGCFGGNDDNNNAPANPLPVQARQGFVRPNDQWRFWSPAHRDQAVGPGVKILTSIGLPPDFHEKVMNCLDALYQVPAGKIVLDELTLHSGASRQVTIVPAFGQGDLWMERGNSCGAGGNNALNLVANELYSDLALKPGPNTLVAFNQYPPTNGRNRARTLADEINATPRYKLKGEPPIAPCNLGVTEAMVTGWMAQNNAAHIYDDFGNDPDFEQVKNAIIIELSPYAATGPGASPGIGWNASLQHSLNDERPPAIGLAHELVHAYYSVRGEQPGWDLDNSTTVLFEYRCVGLGPWAGEAICENSIRSDWWRATPFINHRDRQNRFAVGQRRFYSAG